MHVTSAAEQWESTPWGIRITYAPRLTSYGPFNLLIVMDTAFRCCQNPHGRKLKSADINFLASYLVKMTLGSQEEGRGR